MKSILTLTFFTLFALVALNGQVVYEETFESGAVPDGWTMQSSATDGGWRVGTFGALSSEYFQIPSNGSAQAIVTNDDQCNCNKRNEYLITAPLDLSTYTSAVVSFDVYFLDESFQGAQEDATVEISTDGSNWTVLEDLHGHDSWDRHAINLRDYVGQDSVYIGFRYDDGGGWLYGLAVDNFTISIPPAIKGELVEVDKFLFGETDTNIPISGTLLNAGSDTISSIEVAYVIDAEEPVKETISNLSIASFEYGHFAMSAPWVPSSPGVYQVNIEVLSVNGDADAVEDGNVLSYDITIFEKVDIPNKIDEMLESGPSITEIVQAALYLNGPTDLDFFPIAGKDELWIVNQRTEAQGGSTLTISNATNDDTPNYWNRVDGNAWHFMSLPTGIAFSDDNFNFATSPGVKDANHNNGTFTGPTLWSSDPDIYAQPSGGNGSHLDMLHGSPFSMGIAHEVDNVFWVYDNWNKHIVRYDFVDDHGPGNDYHGDAVVRRYQDLGIFGSGDVPNHMILDKESGWLYIVDNGNTRVMRLDINSGTVAESLAPINEPLSEHSRMGDYTFETIIDTGLVTPSGIDIFEGNLLIGDYANGGIRVYDMNDGFTFKGVIETGFEGLTGIKVGPDGNIWYTNRLENSLSMLEPGEATSIREINEVDISVSPVPAADYLQVVLPESMDLTNTMMHIVGLNGQSLRTIRANGITTTIDVSFLASGNYILHISDNSNFNTTQFSVQR